MSFTDLLIDPLFHGPFVLGLLHALCLPLLGLALRLREEWLVPLALAHVTAAGATLAALAGAPLMIGAGLLAAALALLKQSLLRIAGLSLWAVLLVSAWALTRLIMANAHLPENLLGALSDGQLLLAGSSLLVASLIGVPLAMVHLRWHQAAMLRARLLPGHRPPPHWQVVIFDMTSALSVALAALSIGVMASFAATLLPAWAAFHRARRWRNALWLATGVSVLAYLLAFCGGILLDQPFGALYTVALCATCIALRLIPPARP